MKNFLVQLAQGSTQPAWSPYTGDGVYYMSARMLNKDESYITYTHEMTHDSDQDIYLGGYGRRRAWDQSSLQKVYCKP